jgi:outer membrane lipoprotein SlyB
MRALLIAALVALAGCQAEEPTLGGTVVSIAETEQPAREPSPARYEDLLWPEVAWKLDVRLDNGEEVTVIHKGERRYAPGDRVYVLRAEDGELLL